VAISDTAIIYILLH